MSRFQRALVRVVLGALFLTSGVSAFAKIVPRKTDRSELSDLLQALEKGDWLTKRYAIDGLIHMQPREAALEAVPALVRVIEDRKMPGLRAECAYALGSFGPKAEAAVPALMQLLRQSAAADRLSAAGALVSIRGSTPEVKAVLMEGLKDKNLGDRARAMGTLGRMGPEAKEAVPMLVEALKDVDLRYQALEALRLIDPGAKLPVPILVDILERDQDTLTRERAAEALSRIGPAAEDAAPSLVRAMEDPSPGVRSAARKALGRMKLLHKVVPVSFFIERLKDEDSVRRREAAMALGEIGPPSKEAIPALLWMLRRDISGLRVHAARALVMIGYTEEEVVAPMVETLNGPFHYQLTSEFETELLEALKRVGSPEAKEAVKSFLERKQKAQNAVEDQS